MRFSAQDLIGKRFTAFVHRNDVAAVDAVLAARDGAGSSLTASYRRRIHVAGSAADASPEWLSVQLHGHVVEVFGNPESILLWETQQSRADAGAVGGSVEASAPVAAAQARAAATAKTNARVMTFAIHQLRNALHALDASTHLIAEGAAAAAGPASQHLQQPNTTASQQDLADMLQVREAVRSRAAVRWGGWSRE